jgi:hypothetical protein
MSSALSDAGVAVARGLGGAGDRSNAAPSDGVGAMPLELQPRRHDSHADFHT